MPVRKAPAITPKLKRFAERYFETLDPQGSAEFAGAPKGRLHVTPYEWLKKPEVKKYLKQLDQEQQKRLNISHDRVKREMAKLAFANPQDLVDADGNFKPLNAVPRDAAASITKVTKTLKTDKEGNKTEVWQYTLGKKQESLTKIGEHLEMFKQIVEVKGDVDLVSELTKARKRAEGRDTE